MRDNELLFYIFTLLIVAYWWEYDDNRDHEMLIEIGNSLNKASTLICNHDQKLGKFKSLAVHHKEKSVVIHCSGE